MPQIIKLAHRFFHPTLTMKQLHEIVNAYNDQRIPKPSLRAQGDVLVPMIRVRACHDPKTFEVGFVTEGTFQDYFTWCIVHLTDIRPTLHHTRPPVVDDPLLYTAIRKEVV